MNGTARHARLTPLQVSTNVLRGKNVLLFISDLDLSRDQELSILDHIYTESRQHPSRPESQYEILWLPVVDRSTPWNEAKQEQFESIQAMMAWYSVYHSVHDPSLLDPSVIKYIKEISEGKYTCLYGGENIEWIRKQRLKRWHKLPSVENNTIVQGIITMLSFDRTDQGWDVISQGWDVISQGLTEMAKAKGNTILKSVTQFEQWKQQAEQEGFVAALNANLHDLRTPHHCSSLILPGAIGTIPKEGGLHFAMNVSIRWRSSSRIAAVLNLLIKTYLNACYFHFQISAMYLGLGVSTA
ncbi:hypothetical protein RHMOL_Rhmol12G0124900 [Rhododendron molle]|uniref:Uncharacterized protein n=1 Tax=Rhododendron molle TaxID=49168 RepID=A0ACC0LHP6_RHOML|nr:hypothetical protein RHMOL_Rhmol12G0124900 [Rhododendron molle]